MARLLTTVGRLRNVRRATNHTKGFCSRPMIPTFRLVQRIWCKWLHSISFWFYNPIHRSSRSATIITHVVKITPATILRRPRHGLRDHPTKLRLLASRPKSAKVRKCSYLVAFKKVFIFRIAAILCWYSRYPPPMMARELTNCKVAIGILDFCGFPVLDSFSEGLGGMRSTDHDRNDKKSAVIWDLRVAIRSSDQLSMMLT